MVRMANLRLGITLAQALEMSLGGGFYELDAYNNQVLTDGISFTITTRTFGDSNHWLIEVYE